MSDLHLVFEYFFLKKKSSTLSPEEIHHRHVLDYTKHYININPRINNIPINFVRTRIEILRNILHTIENDLYSSKHPSIYKKVFNNWGNTFYWKGLNGISHSLFSCHRDHPMLVYTDTGLKYLIEYLYHEQQMSGIYKNSFGLRPKSFNFNLPLYYLPSYRDVESFTHLLNNFSPVQAYVFDSILTDGLRKYHIVNFYQLDNLYHLSYEIFNHLHTNGVAYRFGNVYMLTDNGLSVFHYDRLLNLNTNTWDSQKVLGVFEGNRPVYRSPDVDTAWIKYYSKYGSTRNVQWSLTYTLEGLNPYHNLVDLGPRHHHILMD